MARPNTTLTWARVSPADQGSFALSGQIAALVRSSSGLLLDGLSATAVTAYSLRKLRAAYGGYAIRVRRTSDLATQDIGFSGSDLDTTSLLSFIGSSNGEIDTWYDQGSAGINASATNASLYAATAGSINTQNSNPIGLMSNSGAYSQNTAVTINVSTLSVVQCLLLKSGADRMAGFIATGDSQTYANTTSCLIKYDGTNLLTARNYANLATKAMTIDLIASVACIWDGTNVTNYVGNSAGTPVASTGTFGPTGKFYFAGTNDGYLPGSSLLGEFLVFPTALGSSDRAAIYASHQSYWGVA